MAALNGGHSPKSAASPPLKLVLAEHGANSARSGAGHGGAVAQLGERLVRNEEVRGSNPLGSTSTQVRRPSPSLATSHKVSMESTSPGKRAGPGRSPAVEVHRAPPGGLFLGSLPALILHLAAIESHTGSSPNGRKCQCPLYPQKRTLDRSSGMFAKGHNLVHRMSAVGSR